MFRIFIGIALNLEITLGGVVISTLLLSLPLREHGMPFCVFTSLSKFPLTMFCSSQYTSLSLHH